MGGGGYFLLIAALLLSVATAQNLNCPFDTDFCSWTQIKTDQRDWTRQRGQTATSGTGPPSDHTSGAGYYAYLETSLGSFGNKAQLISPAITVPSNKGCLQFYYFMYGPHVGYLNVYRVIGTSNVTVWTRHNNQGAQWKQAFVDLSPGNNIQVVIESTKGQGNQGDIAIDDITYSNGPCVGEGFYCDFEDVNLCGYTKDPQASLNWTWATGSTSSNVRPDSDHSTGSVVGHYITVETTMARPGNQARLLTGNIQGDRDRCLRFFYNMGGVHPGTFNIYAKSGGLGQPLWSLRDMTGIGWYVAEVALPPRSLQYQVAFEVTVLAQHAGAVSVDDVNIVDGACRAPATCNFEQNDFCTWSNDKADTFEWIINRGGTTTSGTGPSADSTFGNSTGHYIYIESSGRKAGDVSRLMSVIIPPAGRPTCFNFKYNMKGAEIGTLNFYVRYGQSNVKVWSLSGDQGSVWQPGSFGLPVGSRTTYSQIIIEGITTVGYHGDIALDDLSYSTTSCTVNPPNATGSSQPVSTPRTTARTTARSGTTTRAPNALTVSCNFEGGLCGWTDMTTDNLNWTRFRGSTTSTGTGPTGDHTTGNGYYIYLETSIGTVGQKARLMSQTITPRQPQQCLSFWYHMKGSTVGSLNIYQKLSTSAIPTSPQWTRHGAQGNAWLRGSLTIALGRPYSIVMEAVRGSSYTGDIAVDDVSLVDGACADVTTTLAPGLSSSRPLVGTVIHKCDFEDGPVICGFTQSNQDDFNWQLKSQTTGTDLTGPNNDHTYQTPQGHYVFIDASNQRIGAKAQLVSPTYSDFGKGDLCLHFFYYMYGDGVGTLNVYVQPMSQNALGAPIWRMSGNQGQRWIVGGVTLRTDSFQAGYQVIFEGVRGSNFRADIAIDDISVTLGSCSNAGACDFENGQCTWTKDRSNNIDWSSFSPDVTKRTPAVDHSTTSAKGTFIFLSSQVPHNPGDKAGLVSETFPPTTSNGACMTFWYFMTGSIQSYLNILITTPGDSSVKLAWQLQNTNQAQTWLQAKVPIPVNAKDYFVTIQGIYGPNVVNALGGIGVDDITFDQTNCALFPPNAIPKVGLPTSPPPSVKPLQGSPNCDFEVGFCAWRQDTTDQFDWTQQAGQTPSAGTGPTGDHSKSDGSGKYIYIETSAPQKYNDKSRLISPDIYAGTYCVQFYYHMYGQTVNKLNMYVMTGLTLPVPKWTKSGTQGRAWVNAAVDVSETRLFNIVFEGVVGTSYDGDIALDDIFVTNGTCATVSTSTNGYRKTCTFETDICGFTQDSTDNFDWTRNRGTTSTSNTGPSTDHTLQTSAGYYIYVESSAPRRPGDKARIQSFPVPANTAAPMCVSFWYSMYGSTIGTLNIYIKKFGALGPIVWSRNHDQGTGWKQATVSVPVSMSTFTVVFEAVVGNGYFSDIALDDIVISSSDCTHPGNCNFDTGMCTWKNDIINDNFDWLITSLTTGSATTGPVQDHTMNNATGKYVFIDASAPRVQGDKAWFVSQDLSPNMSSCLTFWYNMNGATVGTLNLWVKQSSDGSRRPIWSLSGNQGQSWFSGQAVIPPQSGSYQVIFEGVRGSSWNGDIAIDDIVFTSTTGCTVLPANARSTQLPVTMPTTSRVPASYSAAMGSANSDTATSITCTFTQNTCGWTQYGGDNFDWLRNRGSTASFNTGPPSDHTTGGGFYMYIEASNATQGQQGILVSPLVTIPFGQTKCFSLWYYMLGPHVDTLEILTYAGGQTRQLWFKKGDQGSQWQKIQLALSSPSQFQIWIRGTRGGDYDGDIAIDDTSLTDGACIGQGSQEMLNCNFETPCLYQNANNDKTDWLNNTGSTTSVGTGPSADHTTGLPTGHYIYLESSAPAQRGDNAKYVSPVIGSGNGDYCLSFWYHMYGSQMGTLNIHLGDGTSDNIIWSRSSNQGNQWSLAQVPLRIANSRSQITFEGIVGNGYLGDIALDDIKVDNGTCSIPPACNFDKGNLCSWVNPATGDVFDWTMHRGATDTVGTGPSNDHTTSSGTGQYIYIETSYPRKQGDTAYLLSSSLQATSGSTYCFKFWYNMKGTSIGKLSLNYVTNGTLPGTLLWQYGKNIQSPDWNLATVPVTSTRDFKLLFIGAVGSSYTGDIAIDDITYTRQYCPLTPSDAAPAGQTVPPTLSTSTINPSSITSSASSNDCNFESNMCAWVNDNTDIYDWSWGKTAAAVATTVNGIPRTDHSTNSGGGHYVYFDMAQGKQGDEGSTAYLKSANVVATGPKCLRYWYNMNSNVKELDVFIKRSSSLSSPMQQLIGTQGPTWQQNSLNINQTGTYQIVFAGKKGTFGIAGVIALDDITLKDGTCEGQATSTFNLSPTNPFACNLEQPDLCFFTQGTNDTYDWTYQQRATDSVSTGPTNDHTYGTSAGHYLYAEASGATRVAGDVARMNSPIFTPVTTDVCVNFYYHMWGSSMGSLNIRLLTGANLLTMRPVLWTMRGNLGNQWNLGSLTLPAAMLKENFQVVFEAVRGTNYFSDIAIDDISLRTGACASAATCNFEVNTCSFKNLQTDNYDWLRFRGSTDTINTGPPSDHSLQSSQGYYMYLEASYPHNKGDKAVLSSERLVPTAGSGGCFTFWYHMYGSGIGTLNIYISISPQQNTTVWSLSGNQQNAWTNGQVPINSPYSSFFILIEGVRGNDYTGDIAIDDVGYSTTPCGYIPQNAKPNSVQVLVPGSVNPPSTGPSDCNFDLDFCGWTQSTSDKFDWQRQATRVPTTATGPTKDHAGNGYFAFMDSSLTHQANDNAVLVSPAQTGQKCLTFWYFMWGDQVNKLNVYAGINMNTLYWFRQGTQGKQWTQANIHFAISSSYQIYIEGLVGVGPKGDIAIDDITITSGNCPQSNLGVPGPSCDFENDLCGYVQSRTDSFDWTRQFGSTSSTGTGPSNDHSYGTRFGHYVYIEASNAGQGARAVLTASNVNVSTSDMCLEFWYHMYGTGQGVLMATVSTKGITQSSWIKSGNQGPAWNRAFLNIPSIQDPIDIIFEARRGSDYTSDTALDDIVLKTGLCSQQSGSCNFNLDLCSWTNLHTGDDIDWVQNSGSTTSSDTGPTSDHTFGNATGKYLYIESSSPSVAGYKAVLSSQLFSPSDMMCFHFWYNMYGASIGTLRVRLVSYNASINSLPELSHQVLWELSGNQGQGWFQAAVPIVSQNNSFQIFIDGVVGYSFTGDIAIDDPSFDPWAGNNCSVAPAKAVSLTTTTVPPTTVAASVPAGFICNFDTNLCSWTQDNSDKKDWIRNSGGTPSSYTGPPKDHTSGVGYYLYLETSIGNFNDTARLISPTITDNSPQCFSFWYYMYGASVNQLDVQLWGTNNKFTVSWQKNGTQGDAWKQANIDIGGGGTSIGQVAKIVLEAVQGSSYTGDIAIDDINLVPGYCNSGGSNPIDCNFETSDLCGYLQDTTDAFDWTQSTGSTSSFGTGPTSDHTYQTSAGHYMYTESSNRNPGDIARMWSKAFTVKSGQCLSFYYHMYGMNMGTLSFSYGQWVSTGQYSFYNKLWSLKGPQPNNWIQQLVPLPDPPTQPIYLVIQGEVGSGYLSDIAIDDIKLLDSCSNAGECTFETGLCGWVAYQSTFNGISSQFVRATANSRIFGSNIRHPITDHTKGTANGTYMILYSDVNNARQQGQRVSMTSEVIQATGSNGACFHFWFVNYGITFSSLTVSTENGPPLWRLNSTTASQTFTEGRIFVNSPTAFKMSFTVQLKGGQGYVALDDLSITDGYCQVKPDGALFGSAATVAPTRTGVTIPVNGPASNVDCNFEKDLCQWHQNTNDQFDWTRKSGHTDTSYTGPTVDHTLHTDAGYYIYIETSSPRRPNDTAVIESAAISSSGPKCLHFWYHMFGQNINTLNMYKVVGGTRTLVWTRHGSQANDWLDASVDLQLNQGNTIQFEGVRGTDYAGDIGLDDIVLLPGTCNSDTTVNTCDFETDLCGYRSETPGVWQRWQRTTSTLGTGPTNDHTYGTSQGHYVYAEASSPRNPGDKIRMVSLPRSATAASCVSYYYHMYGANMGSLQVRSRTGPNAETVLYTHTGNLGDKWYRNEVTVRTSTSWQLVFESTIGSGAWSDVALDDIVITDGSCGAGEGSCNFEGSMCTWTLLNKGSSWLLTSTTGVTGGRPSTDHTLSTSAGKYMLLNYKSNVLLNAAALVSSPMPPFNGTKCFTFWYIKAGTNTSLTLYITDTTHNNVVPIWSMPSNPLTDWGYASVPIGPQVSNYLMEFDGLITSTYGYLGIDDFVGKRSSTANCPLNPPTALPRGQVLTSQYPSTTLVPMLLQSIYDCSFETDFCKWTQETQLDQFDWIRAQGPHGSTATGPIFDHSYGTNAGWYIYINSVYVANPGQATNQTAWLVSPSIPSTVYCLTLFYNMYGTHVGTLNIYRMPSTGQRKDLYATKSGNQGSDWHGLQLKITGSGNDKVIIEGVRGPNALGDIAIDDIVMQTGQSCQPQLGPGCSFDFGDCGWTQGSNDTFNWQKFQGATTTVGTGPSNDHTLGTRFGYYYHIDASPPRVSGDYAYLLSPTINSSNTQCVRFWYSMNGNNVGTLEFGIMAGDATLGPFRSLWSKSAHQSVNWLLGEATITYPGQKYHIVFKATVGNGALGDIAVDDITLIYNECPFRGNNDFENGLDLYTNAVDNSDKFDWIVASSANPLMGISLTFNDHTYRTQQGHFAIALFTSQSPGNNAYLNTQIHSPDDSWCFTFYYYLTGQDPGTLNVYIYIPDLKTFTLAWSLKDQKDNWNLARVPVSSPTHKFQLVFEAVVGSRTDGMIAIDDIVSQDSLCSTYPSYARQNSIVTRVTYAPVTIPTQMPTPYDCNFESGSTCLWTQAKDDQFDWSVTQPFSLGSVMFGTTQDHTKGTNQGYMLHLPTSQIRHPNDTAGLISPQFPAPGAIHGDCLTFFYRLYGPSVDGLQVYRIVGTTKTLMWQRLGTQGPDWKYAQVEITGSQAYQFEIVGKRGTTYLGATDVDDVRFSASPCAFTNFSPLSDCDFENGICGFLQSSNDNFDWVLQSSSTSSAGTGPSNDHTYGTSQGHYVYVEASNRAPNQRTSLVSPFLTLPRPTNCLKFWYNMYGSSMGELRVYRLRSGFRQQLWRRAGNQGQAWLMAEVPVAGDNSTTISLEFEGVVGSTYLSDIAVDDLSIRAGNCDALGSCDFENGFCTWANTRSGDNFDWLLGSGSTPSLNTGPQTDNTVGDTTGHYAFIEASAPQRLGDKAYLVSQAFEANQVRCLHFYYNMNGAGIGTLNVYMNQTNGARSLVKVWSLSGQQGNTWKTASVSFNSQTPYKIIIEGTVGSSYLGDIAIDDISFTNDNCAVDPPAAKQNGTSGGTTTTTQSTPQTSVAPPTVFDCNFEANFCGWQQDTTDQFDWTRSQGPTGSSQTGPMVDHTKGNAQGWYVYVEASSPRVRNDTARLISQPIGPGQRCFRFFYTMYGTSVYQLNAYIKQGAQMTPIFSMEGDKGPQWLSASIPINPTSTYQLVLEGVRGVTWAGDIAVDDIIVPTGSCPEKTPEAGAVYCTFENTNDPWCGYTQETDDNFDWQLNSRDTQTPNTGPTTDHTFGSYSGHYVYTEGSRPQKTNDTARIRSPTYASSQSTQHCLTFYYVMYGADIGTLNVYQVQTGLSVKSISPKWSRSYDMGPGWRKAEVSLDVQGNYQLLFEGIVGNGYISDIAVDDILVKNGACPNPRTCSFTNDTCLWRNLHDGTDDFDWLRNKGETDSFQTGPSTDHTSGSATGYYMYIEASNRKLGERARLASQLFPQAGKDYCFTFWYNMYGPDIGALKVLVLNNATYDAISSEATLWELDGPTGPDWMNAQVNISSIYTSKPFTIVLEGTIGKSYGGDIAIDDTSIEPVSCQTSPEYALPTTDVLENADCDFDQNNLCKWTQYPQSKLPWTLNTGSTTSTGTGPTSDHSGRGFYIYLEASNGAQEDAAILASPILPPTIGLACFSFWYNMYGSNIGQLQLLTSIGGVTSVQWQRRGTQGSSWLQATVTIQSNTNYQLFLEAVKGNGFMGDIAVDDIQLFHNACPHKALCDFEQDMCSYNQESNDDFDWTRIQKATATSGTGPTADHTLGTPNGHYIYIESSLPRKYKDKARVVSPIYPGGGTECLQFYYNMYGAGMGSLFIYLRSAGLNDQTIWIMNGNRGNLWLLGQANIASPNSYQVVFEGIVGVNETSDIALDDIQISPRPCPNPASCDFEGGFCGYSNRGGDNFDWVITSPQNNRFPNRTPPRDHTTSSVKGSFALADIGASPSGSAHALLVSGLMSYTTGQCLSFAYYIYGDGTINIFLQLGNKNQSLLQLNNPDGQDKSLHWKQTSTDITTNVSYSVGFDAQRNLIGTTTIVIDDVKLVDGLCSQQTSPPPPTTPTLPAKLSILSCDFEGFGMSGSLCSYTQNTDDDFDWLLFSGPTASDSTGPETDHTLGNIKGHYVHIDASYKSPNAAARLTSLQFRNSLARCLTFWYHMHGADINKLNVYLSNSTGLGSPIWTKRGEQGLVWLQAAVEMGGDDGYHKIVFEGLAGPGYRGDIAIDDVVVYDGPCPVSPLCDFEDDGICGFDQDIYDNFDWLRHSGSTDSAQTGPTNDHTYGTTIGHYMYIETSSPRLAGDVARMLTPVYPPTDGRCLKYWYHMYGSSVGSLNVYLRDNRGTDMLLDEKVGNFGNQWLLAQVDLASITPFQVVFEGTVGSSYTGDIAVDDVEVSKDACVQNYGCDFEKGFCSWTQNTTDDLDWLINHGPTPSSDTGPSQDHTIASLAGQYIYLESSSPSKPGDSAVLDSQMIPVIADVDMFCFSMWYFMYGVDIGYLNVTIKTIDDSSPQTIFSVYGPKGQAWKQALINIPTPSNTFQISVIGSVGNGYHSDIALDDFLVSPGSCQQAMTGNFSCGGVKNQTIPYSKVCDFIRDCTDTAADESNCGDCTFQYDWCNYIDTSVGDFQWNRGFNGSLVSNTGPPYDHNNDPTGYYLYVDSSRGTFSDMAEITTNFNFGPSPPSCQVQFYYHMYGYGIGRLMLVLRESQEDTIIFEKVGDQRNSWIQAVVDLGRIAVPFKVLFRATRTYSVNGDIAIDDITFINCNYPAPQSSCQAGQFMCQRKSCVDNSHLCDFSDDCGDGSDEANCAAYPLRTDFEYSYGAWTQDQTDNFDWTRQQGATGSADTGPTRDHTRGTAKGHYVYIETSSPQKYNDKARLISPILSATTNANCQMRFFYHMYGPSIGSLNVYTRSSVNSTLKTLFTRSANQGNRWIRQDLPISETSDYQIVIEATVGSSYQGDIAIDDISLTDSCKLSTNNALPTGLPPSASPINMCSPNFTCANGPCVSQDAVCNFVNDCTDGSDEINCGTCAFESSLCGWRDNSVGIFRWTNVSAPFSTGLLPKIDSTYSTPNQGHYMSVSSGPGLTRNSAVMISPVLRATGPSCRMAFSYYMNGVGSGNLAILLQNSLNTGTSVGTTLWTVNSLSSSTWQKYSVDIGQIQAGYQIVIKSTPLSGFTYGVAIDDVSFLGCQLNTTFNVSTSVLDCSFTGGDFCGYFQSRTDDFDWTLTNQPTPSSETGPSGDHTTGHDYYIYIESSSPQKQGDKAVLMSALMAPTTTNMCLKFWYNMFGADIDTLNVYLANGGNYTRLWTRSGSHGNQWRLGEAPVSSSKNFQIAFEGVVGKSYGGDIALDDISLKAGPCPPQAICDFEIDLCGYTQITGTDIFDWIRWANKTESAGTGPSTDHTTANGYG